MSDVCILYIDTGTKNKPTKTMTNSNNLPKFKIGQSVSYNGQHAKITKQRCYPEEIKKGKSPFFYDIIYISKYTNEVRENFGIRETTFKTYSQ